MSLLKLIKKHMYVQRGVFLKPMYYENGAPIFEEIDRDRSNGQPRTKVEVEREKSKIKPLLKDKESKIGFLMVIYILLALSSYFMSITVGIVLTLIGVGIALFVDPDKLFKK